MGLTGLVLLAAIAMGDQDPPRLVVPNSPDLTIRMRSHGSGPQSTVTIRLKGARQVRERTTEFPGGSSSIAIVVQCDRRRTLLLNPEHKTYAYMPIAPPASGSAPRRTGVAVTSSHVAAGGEEIVIDAVDTGERRQLAGLAAVRGLSGSRAHIWSGPSGRELRQHESRDLHGLHERSGWRRRQSEQPASEYARLQ